MRITALVFLVGFLTQLFGQYAGYDRAARNLKSADIDSRSGIEIRIYGIAVMSDAVTAMINGTLGSGFNPLPLTPFSKLREASLVGAASAGSQKNQNVSKWAIDDYFKNVKLYQSALRIQAASSRWTLFRKPLSFMPYTDPFGGFGPRMEMKIDSNLKFIVAGSDRSFYYGLRWTPHFSKRR